MSIDAVNAARQTRWQQQLARCSDRAEGGRTLVVEGSLRRVVGLTLESGAVRVSLVHYNTLAEIHRFGNVLSDLSKD